MPGEFESGSEVEWAWLVTVDARGAPSRVPL